MGVNPKTVEDYAAEIASRAAGTPLAVGNAVYIQAIMSITDAINEEREACAEIASRYGLETGDARDIEAAIRARSHDH